MFREVAKLSATSLKTVRVVRRNRVLIQEGGALWAEWTTVGRVAPDKQQEEESCVPQLAMRSMTASRPPSWSVGSMGKRGHAEQSGSGVPV